MNTFRRVQIKLHGYETKKLNQEAARLQRAAQLANQIDTGGVAHLPTKRKRWTVLRSPFKHKKAQEAFERRTHFRLITIEGEARRIDKFLEYTKNSLGAGQDFQLRETTYAPLRRYYRHNMDESEKEWHVAHTEWREARAARWLAELDGRELLDGDTVEDDDAAAPVADNDDNNATAAAPSS